MDPSNPNNPPQTPWTAPVDPMWATPQFSFSSYNQVPNAFTQLPQTPHPTSFFQLQQIPFQQQYEQQLKTLQQSQSRPIHTKVQSQLTPDTPSLDDLDDIDVVPETQPQSSKKTSKKSVQRGQNKIINHR
ncbi:hypothetical protein Hdeb2414_s0007g00230311 [Helianthus debilis subsp. tardiflorus]